MPINARLDELVDYPFARLAELLSEAPRVNAPPISMAVGEPQHQPPPLMARTIAEKAHLWNRYPPINGTPDFRAAVARWLAWRYRLTEGMVMADRHVLPIAGTKEGLFLLASAVVPQEKRGRRPTVLVPNPFYLVYDGAGTLAGAEVVHLEANVETGFLPDLKAIADAELQRCALFYLCSPANPQGAIASLDYLEEVIRLARTHDFVLAADECYSEIYDRVPPPGVLEACARMGGALDNVLVFHSLSKRSSAAGLRCGFVAGDPRLIARLQHLRNYGGAQVPLPILDAAAALYADEEHVEANRALYRSKFDVAERVLGRRFGFYRPPGGFFLWLDVGDGVKAARTLWREAALRTLPGAYIARPNRRGVNPAQRYLRLALVHDDATVAEGLGRMASVL